jgi:hypothetical protein
LVGIEQQDDRWRELMSANNPLLVPVKSPNGRGPPGNRTFIPATPVHLNISWLELLTFLPLATLLGASLGLAIGTRVKPQQVNARFHCHYHPRDIPRRDLLPMGFTRSDPLAEMGRVDQPARVHERGLPRGPNPTNPSHPISAIYAAMIGSIVLLGWVGVDGFKKRVTT